MLPEHPKSFDQILAATIRTVEEEEMLDQTWRLGGSGKKGGNETGDLKAMSTSVGIWPPQVSQHLQALLRHRLAPTYDLGICTAEASWWLDWKLLTLNYVQIDIQVDAMSLC